MSWHPFRAAKPQSQSQSQSVMESLPDPSVEWTPNVMFEVIRITTAQHDSGDTPKSWATHVLLDQLQQISQRFGSGSMPLADANRYSLALFQQLTHVRRPRGWRRLSGSSPAVIRRLDLRQHVLPDLKLAQMTFIACEFDDSDLLRARFRLCEFRGCSFRRSNLSLADFRSSRIVGCNFEDATVETSKGLG